MTNKELLTRKQIASLLGCSIQTVDKYTKAGMPVIKIGDLKRYQYNAVINWLKHQEDMSDE